MPKKPESANPKPPKIKKVLITQPRPEGTKSPYFDLAGKYNLTVDFFPFTEIVGVPAKDFRKQKIEINNYTAVIFTSRHAIDHFFRICEELKISVSQETKYFCITEAVALYLQKFILYRKRKVFYGADGANKSLFDVINRHKDNERFLYPCSVNFDSHITNWLKQNNCEFATPVMYEIVNTDIKPIIKKGFDVICFFSAGSVRSLMENIPDYNQNGTRIGAFGESTIRAVQDAGLTLNIKAPQPKSPSMVAALESYIQETK